MAASLPPAVIHQHRTRQDLESYIPLAGVCDSTPMQMRAVIPMILFSLGPYALSIIKMLKERVSINEVRLIPFTNRGPCGYRID